MSSASRQKSDRRRAGHTTSHDARRDAAEGTEALLHTDEAVTDDAPVRAIVPLTCSR
jgi:hypothetical protein